MFANLYNELINIKPDRIVIVGDLVHDYLDLQGEQLMLASAFLTKLATIAPVRITRGNHDIKKKDLKRVDTIYAIVKTLNNDRIKYYNETGFFVDENVTWAVWHHGDNSNPWKLKAAKTVRIDTNNTIIDLYHNPIGGCIAMNGFEMTSKSLIKISDFKGDLSFFGDIHLMQYLDKYKTKAYCGSLIAQDYGEGDDHFHGFLSWDIKKAIATEYPIKSNRSFKNINITPFIDFDDLDFEIDNPTEFMRIRFLWKTLPFSRNKENEKKLVAYVKSIHDNVIVTHKNLFIEENKIDIIDTVKLDNITDQAVQHEIFREYLQKIGVEDLMIEDIIKLDNEITKTVDIEQASNVEWDVLKFGAVNFMSYGSFDIDWRDMDGLFQITGGNTFGKTTILKSLAYILYNKTLETETRMKFGDMRYVNNRNDAKFTEAYAILSSGGEFYGLKRRTDITTNKDGEINGAPTTLKYYLLASADDLMTTENSLENLDEETKSLTQKKIERVIGTYDNFMRIVMTTSDTLNRILSNEMAVFIDSLLYDSGLDVFDKKLKELKVYQDKRLQQSRLVCNVEQIKSKLNELRYDIKQHKHEIDNINTVQLVDINERINTGQTYVEGLITKLYAVDDEIYNLDLSMVNSDILKINADIDTLKRELKVLNESIIMLKETYDEKRLEELIAKRDKHKTDEYALKFSIKEIESSIRDEEHAIEIINGKIFNIKKDGRAKKDEAIALRGSKICPTCDQPLDEDHQVHITNLIMVLEADMNKLVSGIGAHNSDILVHRKKIEEMNGDISKIKADIITMNTEMEATLSEIGVLTNDKNDVEKRAQLQNKIDNLPVLIENKTFLITIAQQKIDNYNNSLLQIESNKKTNIIIDSAKDRLKALQVEERILRDTLHTIKQAIIEKNRVIVENVKLLADYEVQTYRDNVVSQYKECVHRDGIPKQMLANYIIPKINITLEKILRVTQFKVWLDETDLRPRLSYNDRPLAIIDCISASGKERTFSSVPLKFALNQINIKAKPTIFLLDEVMGKLDSDSVEEFVEILHLIKDSMKKVLIIEHNAEISPDYLINVSLSEEGISSLTIS